MSCDVFAKACKCFNVCVIVCDVYSMSCVVCAIACEVKYSVLWCMCNRGCDGYSMSCVVCAIACVA